MSRHSDNEEHRLEQLREIGQLKAHLARDRVDCNVVTLERAILLPEQSPSTERRKYPSIGSMLLKNPFPPVKKKKGKKKKKKK